MIILYRGKVGMKVYFSGIGGIGMSALAQISLIKGYQVLGSDIKKFYITDYYVSSFNFFNFEFLS